jgi:hypothetical protein
MAQSITSRINSPAWRALQSGHVEIEGEPHEIVVVECGELLMPSGHLVAADPFVTLVRHNSYYPVPTGNFPIQVTIDESIGREMYLSLCISPSIEVVRRLLVPCRPDGSQYPEPEADKYYGVAVDAGTICFVDDEAVQRCMPADETSWLETVFDNSSPDCWFKLMDSPEHIEPGLANIVLPNAIDGESIVICHSGWGVTASTLLWVATMLKVVW